MLQITITIHLAVFKPSTESAQHFAILDLWESPPVVIIFIFVVIVVVVVVDVVD